MDSRENWTAQHHSNYRGKKVDGVHGKIQGWSRVKRNVKLEHNIWEEKEGKNKEMLDEEVRKVCGGVTGCWRQMTV